jgi:hypothetical protein
MGNRREIKDRRSNNLKHDREYRCNRRFRPCRRLNNIQAKWLHGETLMRHPLIWFKFRQLGYGRSDAK